MPRKAPINKQKTTPRKAETRKKAEAPSRKEKTAKVPVAYPELSQRRPRGTPGAGYSANARRKQQSK